MDRVSVILTTYNSESTLQRTVDSIINQNGINIEFEIELIVVDDCSNDNTRHILKKNNIDFYSTIINSGGPNKGRNIGLKQATGNYICFIDHDDTWEPDKTRLQLKLAREFPIVSTGYRLIDSSFNKVIHRVSPSKDPVFYKQNETFLHKLLKDKKGQILYFSTLMIHSELKDIMFEEHFGMVDFDWILRILENRTSAEIPEILMTRYVNMSNLSLNSDYRKSEFYYSLYALENYQEKYPGEVKKAINRLNGSRARYFYRINNMKNARRHFMKASMDFKNLSYILTTYFGSSFIRKNIYFFG